MNIDEEENEQDDDGDVFKISIISSYQIDDVPKVCNQHQILNFIYIYFSLYKLICKSDFFSFRLGLFDLIIILLLFLYIYNMTKESI